MTYPKRLIEVDLPIARISAHARREKSIRRGHISTLHIWWARRPLAACRAVICAALWPDPADELCPQAFREAAVEQIKAFARRVFPERITKEGRLLSSEKHCSPESRARWDAIAAGTLTLDADEPSNMPILRSCLLDFIADFANWDNSTLPAYLETSRALTGAAHEALGGVPGTRPLVVDPFAGGGAIPLEALRVGGGAFASDLNPIPVLLNTVQQDYVPRFGTRLAKQVRTSAGRVRDQLVSRMRHFYVDDGANEIPHVYFWARTIRCEGPSCGFEYPLLKSLWLRKKPNYGVALSLQPDKSTSATDVRVLSNANRPGVNEGTSRQGAATCPNCGFTTPVERVRQQLSSRCGGADDAQLIAVGVASKDRPGKRYRAPTGDELARFEKSLKAYERLKNESLGGLPAIPDEKLNHLRGFFNVVLYGMTQWGQLFNPRQMLLMVNMTRCIRSEWERLSEESRELADAVATCLALAAGKVAQYGSSCCRWKPTGETLIDMFGRQAIPMVWDFAEAYPFGDSTGDYQRYVEAFCTVLDHLAVSLDVAGTVNQASATHHPLPDDSADAFVTDPPYYDAIPYADLSDYFYVWLRRMIGEIHPAIFGDILSPKEDECVMLAHRAAMYRHKDGQFFESMMAKAMLEARRIAKPKGIGVVVFANKTTAGWEAMLSALVESGWVVSASWPIDTEMGSRLRAQNSAVLASSVHLVCRPRENPDGSLQEETGEWRDVLGELPKCIRKWMPRLASEGVVGADAIFACLGPALEIFSRYSRVEKANGEAVPLREYLEHVWAAVSTEALSMIFQDADAAGLEPDARLTAMWLWTLGASGAGGNGKGPHRSPLPEGEGVSDEIVVSTGYTLEFDAARKIAQGLGIHLEQSESIVAIKGDKARLLPVSERAGHLFGKERATAATARGRRRKRQQRSLFDELDELEADTQSAPGGELKPQVGETVLDRVHQSMILFAAGRGEALRRFLVDDGAGTDARFWRLAQSLSALYPKETDERRWVDGVLARKKGFGF